MAGVEIGEFIAARLDEDDAAAKAAQLRFPGPWEQGDNTDSPLPGAVTLYDASDESVGVIRGSYAAAHLARHDPARVLREVEAKRAILVIHEPLPSSYGEPSVCRSCWPQPWIGTHPLAPCPTVRNLAAVYCDHPDYDPAWAPEQVSA